MHYINVFVRNKLQQTLNGQRFSINTIINITYYTLNLF